MKLLATFTVVLAVAACGSSEDDHGKLSAAEAVQKTCEHVRAGIADFNKKDYQGTAEHFQDAVPFAKIYATAQPEAEARALLEAVNYYAALPAEDYAKAARTSADFARFKAVTLNQCAGAEPIDDSEGMQT